MKHTVLLRLVGPLQSWGMQSRFDVRDAGWEPSKSGVIGLVCAAMGVPRDDEAKLAELAGLRLGVRVDREGRLSKDFQTAKDVLRASADPAHLGERKTKEQIEDCVVSTRYYLADAAYLAGLEGEQLPLLRAIHEALSTPKWLLFLGRKSFVCSAPVYLPDGLKENTGLEEALRTYPRLSERSQKDQMRAVIEDRQGSIIRPDQPLSFAGRRFAPRRVCETFVDSPDGVVEEP